MKEFSLGFIFDASHKKVLLVHKEKPDWQKGKINGIGGKLEQGESPVACIARETREESCLNIPEENWTFLGLLSTKDSWRIHTYMTTYEGNMTDAQKGDHEEIEWFSSEKLPPECIPNLTWIIPFAQEQFMATHTCTFDVVYENHLVDDNN